MDPAKADGWPSKGVVYMVRSNNSTSGVPVATSGGFTCGYIDGNVFRRKFDPAKHIIRQPVPALALEDSVIVKLAGSGVKSLRFFTADGHEYTTTLEHFLECSEPFQPAGWPKQHRLPLIDFIQKRTGKAVQLAMNFGGAG